MLSSGAVYGTLCWTYRCTPCGGASPKWLGQCPACTAWNTLVESVAEAPTAGTRDRHLPSLAKAAPVATLSEIEASEVPREPTGIAELDRVLGGGVVRAASR